MVAVGVCWRWGQGVGGVSVRAWRWEGGWGGALPEGVPSCPTLCVAVALPVASASPAGEPAATSCEPSWRTVAKASSSAALAPSVTATAAAATAAASAAKRPYAGGRAAGGDPSAAATGAAPGTSPANWGLLISPIACGAGRSPWRRAALGRNSARSPAVSNRARLRFFRNRFSFRIPFGVRFSLAAPTNNDLLPQTQAVRRPRRGRARRRCRARR